jgi:hypothetical protein
MEGRPPAGAGLGPYQPPHRRPPYNDPVALAWMRAASVRAGRPHAAADIAELVAPKDMS